jgi:hypothetical protein
MTEELTDGHIPPNNLNIKRPKRTETICTGINMTRYNKKSRVSVLMAPPGSEGMLFYYDQYRLLENFHTRPGNRICDNLYTFHNQVFLSVLAPAPARIDGLRHPVLSPSVYRNAHNRFYIATDYIFPALDRGCSLYLFHAGNPYKGIYQPVPVPGCWDGISA